MRRKTEIVKDITKQLRKATKSKHNVLSGEWFKVALDYKNDYVIMFKSDVDDLMIASEFAQYSDTALTYLTRMDEVCANETLQDRYKLTNREIEQLNGEFVVYLDVIRKR